jgi:CRP-like cAMP-binding protein
LKGYHFLNKNCINEILYLKSDFLKDIPANRIQQVMASGIRKNFEKGDIVFRQGDPAKLSYFLETGQLKLSKLHEDGREAIIRYIGPGELTAASVVLKETEYPLTAEALSPTSVISWDKNKMYYLMQENPQIAINILSLVLERLEEMQQRFLEISAEQAERRIARALLRIMKHAGTKTNNGILIDFPVSREDIADFTGTTHFTVSRVLSDWKRKGWVTSARQKIKITDAHALVMLSENL